jgi:hypothetical protein
MAFGDARAREMLDRVLATDGTDTLASRTGLDSLRTEAASSAGFLTLSAYMRSVEAITKANPDSKVNARDVMLAMPAHGETPILYGSKASAVVPSLQLSVRVPKAALQDLTAAVVSLAAQSGAL